MQIPLTGLATGRSAHLHAFAQDPLCMLAYVENYLSRLRNSFTRAIHTSIKPTAFFLPASHRLHIVRNFLPTAILNLYFYADSKAHLHYVTWERDSRYD